MDRKRKVLVVDDEANALLALAELLREAGYEVATASNGRDALALLECFQPDLLLTDVRMPGLSGLDLMRAARESRHPASVVLMSASQPHERPDAPMLDKPIRVDLLFSTLDRLAAGS